MVLASLVCPGSSVRGALLGQDCSGPSTGVDWWEHSVEGKGDSASKLGSMSPRWPCVYTGGGWCLLVSLFLEEFSNDSVPLGPDLR